MNSNETAKHTPGPWSIRPSSGIIANDAGNVNFIADIRRHGEAATMTETDGANARLIAASPTLYEFVLDRAKAGDAEAGALLSSLNLPR